MDHLKIVAVDLDNEQIPYTEQRYISDNQHGLKLNLDTGCVISIHQWGSSGSVDGDDTPVNYCRISINNSNGNNMKITSIYWN